MTRVTSAAGVAPAGRDPGASIIGVLGDRPVGVVLRRAAPSEDEAPFEIALVDRDERTLLTLGPYPQHEVVATWRQLAASSGLELMIELGDGSLDRPYVQLGRVRLGAIRVRRRHGLLAGRRPRFLVRRKTARLPLRPEVHRDEREIVSGVGA